MRIELARPGSAASVVGLLAAQFREHGIVFEGGRLSEAVLGLVAEAGRGAVLIAYDPEPVAVAVLAYTWTLEHGGMVAWLDELFVVPERRGGGVGGALLRRALEFAEERGVRAVELEVDADHARAERLYEREGFVRLPRRRWAKRLV